MRKSRLQISIFCYSSCSRSFKKKSFNSDQIVMLLSSILRQFPASVTCVNLYRKITSSAYQQSHFRFFPDSIMSHSGHMGSSERHRPRVALTPPDKLLLPPRNSPTPIFEIQNPLFCSFLTDFLDQIVLKKRVSVVEIYEKRGILYV